MVRERLVRGRVVVLKNWWVGFGLMPVNAIKYER